MWGFNHISSCLLVLHAAVTRWLKDYAIVHWNYSCWMASLYILWRKLIQNRPQRWLESKADPHPEPQKLRMPSMNAVEIWCGKCVCHVVKDGESSSGSVRLASGNLALLPRDRGHEIQLDCSSIFLRWHCCQWQNDNNFKVGGDYIFPLMCMLEFFHNKN